MSERFRKWGASTRITGTGPSHHTVISSEGGESFTTRQGFECRSIEPDDSFSAPETTEFAAFLQELHGLGDAVDHFALVAGRTRHRVEDNDGIREWAESQARIFVTLASPDGSLRCSLLSGGQKAADLSSRTIESVAALLQRVDRSSTAAGGSIVLAPQVSAALWPLLARLASPAALDALVMRQTAGWFTALDGRGMAIAQKVVTALRPDWPNAFRPSYRAPALPAPLNLDVDPRGSVEGDWQALAMLQPFHVRQGQIAARLLCSAGEKAAALTMSFPPDEWIRRIQAVGDRREWFPYDAGSWGRDVVIAVEG